MLSHVSSRIHNFLLPGDKPEQPASSAPSSPTQRQTLSPASPAPSTRSPYPHSPPASSTPPSTPDINDSYWAHITDSFLMTHDKQTWIISVAFVGFIMFELGPELAFTICMLQMLVQRYLMYQHPDLYRKHRDKVCAAVRAWRVFMVYHLSSRGYAGTLSTQSHGPLLVVLRQVLVGTGSLINLVVAVGYQLRFSTHFIFQMFAVAASLAGGTLNVVRAIEAHPETTAVVERARDKFSDLGAMLFEGVPSTSSPAAICRPPAALSVTLLTQIYVGLLLPSYVLYILETTTKRRFMAETPGLGTLPGPPPAAAPVAPRREPFLGRLAGLLLHAFSLLVLLCTCWEIISFSLCIYPRLGSRAVAV